MNRQSKICQHCGKLFYRHQGERTDAWERRKTCNRTCGAALKRGRHVWQPAMERDGVIVDNTISREEAEYNSCYVSSWWCGMWSKCDLYYGATGGSRRLRRHAHPWEASVAAIAGA